MSTSGERWQSDFPLLSSLILNVGAAGLKRIAGTGVHVHTLLCMGEIAGLCPASPTYRQEINFCRQQQRKQSIWLNDTVEIGTASNFVADELLQTRAGENILALLSTVVPILSEDECDRFILELFNECGVNADKTPGIGQLQAFRHTLLPLARKPSFKDGVYECQFHLNGFLPDEMDPLDSSIPAVETLVQLVLLFRRLIKDSSRTLSFHGRQGASWAIAYARQVLGLPVCISRTLKDPVPIEGGYQGSRVLVYLSEKESKCELLETGIVKEVVVPAKGSGPLARWLVDVDNVDLKALHIPVYPACGPAIPEIMGSLIPVLIAHNIRYLDRLDINLDFEFKFGKVQSYLEYCQPQIRQRGLEILRIMGFGMSSGRESGMDRWEDHIKFRDCDGGFELSPGPTWLQLLLAKPGVDDADTSSGNEHGPPALHFTHEGRRSLGTMCMFAEMASWLAFSNWGKNNRTLSATALAFGIHNICGWNHTRIESEHRPQSVFPGNWEISNGCIRYQSGELPLSQKIDRTQAIYGYLTYILGCGSTTTPTKPSAPDVIVMEVDGHVMTRASPKRYSIDFEAVFFNLYSGHISIGGERRSSIRQKDQVIDSQILFLEHDGELCPSNAFSKILMLPVTLEHCRTHVERSDHVFVQHKEKSSKLLCSVLGPTMMSDDLVSMFVTNTCSHGYHKPFLRPESPSEKMGLWIGSGSGLNAGDKVPFDPSSDALPPEKPNIFFQDVDQNPAGQWIAAYNRTSSPCSYMLQRNMCTECTVGVINHILHKNPGREEFYNWVIIPAMLKGESIITLDTRLKAAIY
ncbi:MAG: hypothetical protein LQ349_005697 [Xanthoria aureola]|nr:MAG: hypothetical protein LQ349_005697 [Xanthoria aureola]